MTNHPDLSGWKRLWRFTVFTSQCFDPRWTGYGFGHISDWISEFDYGEAKLTIASAGKTVLAKAVQLTPGPLVVALRPQ